MPLRHRHASRCSSTAFIAPWTVPWKALAGWLMMVALIACGTPPTGAGTPAEAAGQGRAAVGSTPEGDSDPVELHLYAAASLADVLEELAPRVKDATGARLVLHIAGSSTLARQIVAAHRADVFFSASEWWMDQVSAEGLVEEASRCAPLSNSLVVIVPTDSRRSIGGTADLVSPEMERLSLAEPEAVPAGRYARAWLEAEGVWDEVRGRVVPALDVRAALGAVASGAVAVGVVYRTDAATSRRVRVAYEVPEARGPRIVYALAALADRPHTTRAQEVVEWLCGPEAAKVFRRHGFVAHGSRLPAEPAASAAPSVSSEREVAP